MTIDQNGPVVLSWFSVIVGMISGLIMGDMNTGLVVVVPSVNVPWCCGSWRSICTQTTDLQRLSVHLSQSVPVQGTDAAMAVGLPVGLLAIQLEVVVRIVNNFVAHKMQNDNNAGKWGRMNREAWLGPAILFPPDSDSDHYRRMFWCKCSKLYFKIYSRVGNKWTLNSSRNASGSRNRNVDALHAGKEIPSIYFDWICTFRLFKCTGTWNCNCRICSSFLVFLQQSLENQMTEAVTVAANTVTEEMGDDFDE